MLLVGDHVQKGNPAARARFALKAEVTPGRSDAVRGSTFKQLPI